MNILIGFEESQTVMKAFRKRGHNAYSCDLKQCSGGNPKYHLQMDIFKALVLKKWDFIGIHPECTALCVSGNSTYAKGKTGHYKRIEAVKFTLDLWETVCSITNMAYMENPIGVLSGNIRLPKPQIIQPYFFGDPEQKTTCLWLHNLPHLFHAAETDLFNSEISHVKYNPRYEWIDKKTGKIKSQPKWYALAKKTDGNRSKIRSKTFPGIAEQMAEQWGAIL